MFSWFKKEKVIEVIQPDNVDFEDQIEEALWDVKEQFDLETEEVEKTVLDKRQKLSYMRKTLKREL
jgi:CBS-domain-containing membrane protein